MSKKIKIIDLLNKIASGEEIPKKIKYACYDEWEWNGDVVDYKAITNDYEDCWLFDDYMCNLCNSLNKEVEILEDNTEEIEEYKGEDFEQLGYEVGKLSIAIARGFEEAFKELRKENNNDN